MLSKTATLALFLGSASAFTKTEDIVMGVAMGIAKAEINAGCIQDVENVITDAEHVVADFKEKSLKSVIAGIKEIVHTVGDVKTGIKDCTGQATLISKLEAAEATLTNPMSFAYHVGKDLLINRQDIYNEVNTAVADYESGKWFDFGEQIGMAAAKTLLGEQVQIEAAQIMNGLALSYGGNFNLDALLACVGEEDKAALIVNAVIPVLKDGIETKNGQEIVEGAIGMFAAYQQAMKGLPACEAVDPGIFQKIDKHIDFTTTKVNLFNLSADSYIEIVEKIYQAWESKDFTALGSALGELLQKLFDHEREYAVTPAPEEKISRKDIASFTQGYFQATNVGTINFTALLECIYAADQAAEVAEMEVHLVEQAFKDRSAKEAIPAAIGAVALVQAAKQAIPTCESVDPTVMNWTTYNDIIQMIESPSKFMKVVDREIVANGKTVTKEIGTTIDAVRSGDFYTAGVTLGSMLSSVTETEQLFLY